MIDKPLKDIQIEDIQVLLDNQVPESRTLDYKSTLKITDDKEKKEFCADVTAFANARGGDIIFGVSEDRQSRLPVELSGILLERNEDAIKVQINQILRSKISPKLQNVEIKVLEMNNGKQILILRVGESNFSPHGVNFGDHYRFFVRNINSKDSMDVEELRGKFLESNSLEVQIREFISSRLADIVSNQNGYLSNELPFLTIHFVPYSAFTQREKFSVKKISDAIKKSESQVLSSYAPTSIFYDGIRLNYPDNRETQKCFANYYSNGVVEQAGNNRIFVNRENEGKTIKLVFTGKIVEVLIDVIKKTIDYYKTLEINGPLNINLAIINARGYKTSYAEYRISFSEDRFVIDRNLIPLPPLFVEEISDMNYESVTSTIRPLLDSLWNAFGFPACWYFDDEGNFDMSEKY